MPAEELDEVFYFKRLERKSLARIWAARWAARSAASLAAVKTIRPPVQ